LVDCFLNQVLRWNSFCFNLVDCFLNQALRWKG
jgi:hypothetical protein